MNEIKERDRKFAVLRIEMVQLLVLTYGRTSFSRNSITVISRRDNRNAVLQFVVIFELAISRIKSHFARTLLP